MKLIQLRFRGLFGNMCISYATCRAIASRHNCEFQCDQWPGETVFTNVHPNPIRTEIKPDLSVSGCWFDQEAIDKADVVAADFFLGVMSKESCVDGLFGTQLFEFSRAQLREWFVFRPEFAYQSPYENVFHLRCWNPNISHASAPWCSGTVYPCANISGGSYIRAAEAVGYDLRDFEIVHDRAPHTKSGVPEGLMFVIDFQIMAQAKVLFRANSSFSWLAGAIGTGKIFSPKMSVVSGAWDGTPQSVEFMKSNEGSFWPGGIVGQSELDD